ncbi:MAG: hypothetical protein RMK79_12270, partial [Anaerolineae bacterium]|nr:hypothetical protein [Anaerolineae bacterium]
RQRIGNTGDGDVVSQLRRLYERDHSDSGITVLTPPDSDLILWASEVGHYAFCQRAWWLARVLGRQPDDQSGLSEGLQFHHRLGRSLVAIQRWQRVSYVLIGLGLAVGISTILGSCGATVQ